MISDKRKAEILSKFAEKSQIEIHRRDSPVIKGSIENTGSEFMLRIARMVRNGVESTLDRTVFCGFSGSASAFVTTPLILATDIGRAPVLTLKSAALKKITDYCKGTVNMVNSERGGYVPAATGM